MRRQGIRRRLIVGYLSSHGSRLSTEKRVTQAHAAAGKEEQEDYRQTSLRTLDLGVARPASWIGGLHK